MSSSDQSIPTHDSLARRVTGDCDAGRKSVESRGGLNSTPTRLEPGRSPSLTPTKVRRVTQVVGIRSPMGSCQEEHHFPSLSLPVRSGLFVYGA